MSLCRSNRFYSISISFLFILFLLNSHCKSPTALLFHSVLKTAFAAHYGDKSTKNILLPQIFPHLFIHKIKKEKHFFLLLFPQNRNFSPNNLVVFDLHHGLYYVEFETKRINYAQEQSHSRLN